MSHLHIQIIHGPNLNMLGTREPGHYGSQTLADIDEELIQLGDKLGVRITTFQSNHEG
ncbi:MAG TPA: type II 3-dehydroquinate dehydratase, partial [Ghiorsea sp.]|nr:type II 3-dehydroquinate dehydratase [Ghiorsea sp.]